MILFLWGILTCLVVYFSCSMQSDIIFLYLLVSLPKGCPWLGIKQLLVSKTFTLYHWICVCLEAAIIVQKS